MEDGGNKNINIIWQQGKYWLSLADVVAWLDEASDERLRACEDVLAALGKVGTYDGGVSLPGLGQNESWEMLSRLAKAQGAVEGVNGVWKDLKAMVDKAIDDLLTRGGIGSP